MKAQVIKIFVVLMVLFGTGCAQKGGNVKSSQTVLPDTLYMQADTLKNRVARAGRDLLALEQEKISEEAVATIMESYALMDLILRDSLEAAKELNKELIGKLEILLAENPDLALLPIEARIFTRDVTTTIDVAKKITEEAEKAFKEKYYQQARLLLQQLSSEIVVVTTYLPLKTYPDAMKLVGVLLKNNQKEEALVLLNSMLNTLVIEETRLPLPVLRAVELIKEAALLAEKDKKQNKEAVLNLLEHARYQLELAEIMGYGHVEKEYKPLYKLIKELKKKTESEENTKSLFEELKNKLETFKKSFYETQRRNKKE